MESDLAAAASEMTVYFTRHRLTTGQILECEALVRWAHPRRGLVTPSQFIRVAEETDLIFSLGRYVLEEACRQLSAWRGSMANAGDLVMSVNISAKQLRNDGLVDLLREILETSGLPAVALKLEITESVALTGAEPAIPARSTARLGSIAIDDFGTATRP